MRNKKRKRKREICMEKRGYENALRTFEGQQQSGNEREQSTTRPGEARQVKSRRVLRLCTRYYNICTIIWGPFLRAVSLFVFVVCP